MRKYIINGKFLGERMQGIVRYAREITKELDLLVGGDTEVVIAVPPNAADIPQYKNIKAERLGKNTGVKWEQTDLRKYVKSDKGSVCVNLCNIAPLGVQPGITVIHDIMYKVNPSHFTTFRNKISRLWHVFQYRYISKHEKAIITDSLYSKSDIEKHYPSAKGKVTVIPCGWQHILKCTPAADWKERYPFLEKDGYYFSLSTLAKNKNVKWIIETARNNPDMKFVLAGKKYEADTVNLPENVYMVGFVSDEDVCALITNCRAFLFPSIYEGFGIPPLEAMALGAQAIVSNATCLPEIFGNSVHYIDPYDYSVNLSELLNEPIESSETVLEKYSWRKSAEALYKLMTEIPEKKQET